jgi:ribose/xylose/arabinose/galactoside ABC-type transport system permease subunit
MKLSPKALGLSLGILLGVALMVTTWIVMAQGGGGQLVKLHRIFPGYTVSLVGSIIGLVYGFVCGLIDGVIIAWLYNMFACEKKAA